MDEKTQEKTSYFLGIDYGISQVGLAIADSETKIAFAYKTLRNNPKFMDELGAIIKRENINLVVIGKAEVKDKYKKPFESREIGKRIMDKFKVKVEYITEMFTTKMAQNNLKERRAKEIKRLDNQEAARIILQDWIGDALLE